MKQEPEENSEYDHVIENLEDRIADLENDLDKANEHIDELKGDITEQQSQLSNKDALITERDDHIEYYEHGIEQMSEFYDDDIDTYFTQYTLNLIQNYLRALVNKLVFENDFELKHYFMTQDARQHLKECIMDEYIEIVNDLLEHIPKRVYVEHFSNSQHTVNNDEILIDYDFFFSLNKLFLNEVYRMVFVNLYGFMNHDDREIVKEDEHKSNTLKFLYKLDGYIYLKLFEIIFNNHEIGLMLNGDNKRSIFNREHCRYRDDEYEALYKETLIHILSYCAVHPEINSYYYDLIRKYFFNSSNLYYPQCKVIERLKYNFYNRIQDLFFKYIDIDNRRSVFTFSSEILSLSHNEYIHSMNDTILKPQSSNPDEEQRARLFDELNINNCSYNKNMRRLLDGINSIKIPLYASDSSQTFIFTPAQASNTIQDYDLHNSASETFKNGIIDYTEPYSTTEFKRLINYIHSFSYKALYLFSHLVQPVRVTSYDPKTNTNISPVITPTDKLTHPYNKLINTHVFLQSIKTINVSFSGSGVLFEDTNMDNSIIMDRNDDGNYWTALEKEIFDEVFDKIDQYINTTTESFEYVLSNNSDDLVSNSYLSTELDNMRYILYTTEKFLDHFEGQSYNLMNLKKRINKLKLHV